MSIPAIPQLDNFPDLIRALNERLRSIDIAVNRTAPAASPANATASTAGSGTHVDRLNTTPAAGAFFVETDRGNALYEAQTPGGVLAWVLVSARMTGTLAQRPADLGASDTGFLYSASNGLDYSWSGTAWVALDTARGGAALTHAGAIPQVGATGKLSESVLTQAGATVGVAVAVPTATLDVGSATTARIGLALTGAVAGSGGLARGINISNSFTLTATANGDALNALFFNPVFSVGGFSGVTKFVIRSNSPEWSTFAGNFGFGGQAAPAYPVDVTGDANVSGVLRVAGTQVVGARKTGWATPTATLARTALTNTSTATDVLQHLAALITDLMNTGIIGA